MTVEEVLDSGRVPLWRHPGWSERFPWLVQATTGRGDPAEPFDLGLFGQQPVGGVLERWRRLREATEMPACIHARQVHGAEVRRHAAAHFEGLLVAEGYDGHVTVVPGLLLAVSVADCVPVFLVEERSRTIALVHAGWRGVAASIVERAIDSLAAAVPPGGARIWLHAGPSICGACYEVGPEVHRAVSPGAPPPSGPTPIDLRAAIVERAGRRGVDAGRISLSAHCTRCGPGAFFSHRGGSPARQMGVLGLRP
jgi:YfiH family protein